jgi:ferric-dicitrate binding protein FerR (iron transport regulator)
MTADQSPQASNKPHDEAVAWLLKNRDINQSAHEARAFEAWLDRSPENRTAYEEAERRTGQAGAARTGQAGTAAKPRSNAAKILAIAILLAALAGGTFMLLHG